MTTNANQPNYPDYISKEFFEKSLKCGLNSPNVSVKNFQISAGSSSGENYCSDIYRANVTYQVGSIGPDKEVSLIVKAMPYTDVRGPVFKEMDVFGKEVNFYAKILPKMSDILNGEFIGAKLYYATEDPIQLLVFQDLKTLGYRIADREVGLDEKHCRITLEKLARIHAASVKLAEKDPKIMDKYSYGFFMQSTANSPVMDGILGESLSYFVEEAATWPGFESSVEKIRQLRKNVIQKLTDYCEKTPSSIKVFNHGDAWVNNFMFKYEEGRPIDVVFVDYQLSFYSSPGIDLNYFLCTSPRYEVREQKRDQLIDGYIKAFLCKLHDLQCTEQPTAEMMKKEIATREFYGFFAATSILPLVLLNKNDAKDSSLENLMDQEAAAQLRRAMYSQPSYQQAMKSLLNRFQQLKIFDNIN